MPPGQRLIVYFFMALFLIVSPVACLPGGVSSNSAITLPGGVSNNSAITLSSHADPANRLPPFLMVNRLADAEAEITNAATHPGLDAGVFAVEPATGNYLAVNAQKTYSAASMIKVPVLVALLTAIDNHKINFDQILSLRPELIGGGSGMLQWRPVNSKVSLKQTAELMIVISDNTATNLIIDLLGGKDVLNSEIQSWGLTNTRINNFLPDLEGSNYTTPYDLVYLLGRIQRGEILTPQSREYLFGVMERTHTRTLLPRCLLPGDRIAHKSGDIGSMVGEVGFITTATGKKYFISVQVARPHNDQRGNELVRTIAAISYSKIVGKECSWPKTMPMMLAGTHTVRHAHRRFARHHGGHHTRHQARD